MDDLVLFVLISVFAGWILSIGMISSRQKLQLHSVLEVPFGQEDDIQRNTATVGVDGWHVSTRYSLHVTTAIVGGEIAISVLTTTKPQPSKVGEDVNNYLAMPTVADNSGGGGQVSAMAPIMPSTVFIDPAMAIGASFQFKKTHFIEVEKTEQIDFMLNFGSLVAAISAGEVRCIAIATILIGAYLRGTKLRSMGTDVVIHAVDIGNSNKFGAWRPFCDGRMGNIRATVFTENGQIHSTLFFGPSVSIAIPQADDDAEVVLMPAGELVAVPLAGKETENISYSYATNFVRGPWFVERDDNVAWAMDDNASIETRVMLEFCFIPNFNAPFSIPITMTELEIGTPDFEDHWVLPFDCFITKIVSDFGIIGTVVGLVMVELHLIKSRSSVIPTFVGSEPILDGSLMGTRSQVARIQSSTKKASILLEVFPRETSASTFTGVDTEASEDMVNQPYDAGSAIAVFVQAIDATTISIINGDVTVHGFSKVRSKQYHGNFMESSIIVMHDEVMS